MERNQKYINLEAYLDGELTSQEATAFTASVAADPELHAALVARRTERQQFQSLLGEDLSSDELFPKNVVILKPDTKTTGWHKYPVSRIGIALAASICLVFLVPNILRNDNRAEGPRSILTISGQVAVVRFGEIPGETTMLETGAIELPAGLSR